MKKTTHAIEEAVFKQKITKNVVKQCEERIIPRVQSSCLAATVLVLHDKFGFGTKRLERYMGEVFEYFDSVYNEYLSFDDIKKCVYDELGIDFVRLEEERTLKNKDK